MDKIENLISEMSVAEKALLCSGRKFWFTRGIKKYGIEPYMVTDGPHGLRKQSETADNLGVNESVKATCFPPACVMANTWDSELISGVGERIAEEAKQEQVSIVLGPGANIKRSPLCGRNFEYYSEDPYLSGGCAAAFINGVQSKGVGTSLKHYAVNNQENDRMRINAVVDERALREIYLASFERAVKEGKPYTVMCSYNQVNGEFASENKKLLTDILRKDWGFSGYVMTDWGAINDRVKALKSGLDLEMPGGSGESVFDIVSAVAEGRLEVEVLNNTVRRLLKANFAVNAAKDKDYKYDKEEHHNYARKVAGEGAVLLKNENKVLPLDNKEPITVIGGLFKTPRYQGSGSSLINPNKLVSPYDAFVSENIDFKYAEGYPAADDKPDDALIDEAVELARTNGGKIVVFAGLTLYYESEGFDRKHMRLPENQNLLIEKLIGLHKDLIIVLYGGSPVEMPWINGVNAVLNMYLPGQAVGEATADVLFGRVNPSGKLAETFPLKLEDNPSHKYFPEGPVTIEYRESVFVGYRYYSTAGVPVLFPFGYGLSYTEFEYSSLTLDKKEFKDGDTLRVKCKITNKGAREGKEAVQLYVKAPQGGIFRPEKELKGYQKVAFKPGESKTVQFTLDKRAFCYYNVKISDWAAESGDYQILIGASSEDIRLSETVSVVSDAAEFPYDREKIADYYDFRGKAGDTAFTEILGYTPPFKDYTVKPIRWDTTPKEARVKFFGRVFYKLLIKGIDWMYKGTDENALVSKNFMKEMATANTMRSIATTNGGMMSMGMAAGLIDILNGKLFKGLHKLIKAARRNLKYNRILLKLENGDK